MKLVKMDCGYHYGEKGGPCSKCANDPAIAYAVWRILELEKQESK